ncbi:MAG TPA: GNAT family N-acetyltransferase [Pyrinomonadaceae bacterium]|jgi:ribosomal protein S18 acetylase RimI-like enzyme
METSFRLARPADADALLAMIKELWGHERMPFEEAPVRAALARLLEDDAYGVAYLMLAGAEAAGYFVLGFGYSLEFHGRDAFVDELFVRDEFRGRGLGAAALDFAAGVCRERGVRALHLEVDHSNPRAHALYRKSGFQDHERHLMTRRL